MDWSRSAVELHNLVRASIPWPVAQCMLNGQPCRILQSRVIADTAEGITATPGEIVHLGKGALHVATGDGVLGILRIQLAGKKPLAVDDFLRGCSMRPGDRFE
jgi:methionyl-tRNA formyltransferase